MSLMAIHLSGNGLEYYERIFLRTLLDAKCSSQFRKLANSKKAQGFRPMDKSNMFGGRTNFDNFEQEMNYFL